MHTFLMEKSCSKQQCLTGGGFWFALWLFTIGFLKLTFWKGVLAIILWPYFLGVALSRFLA